MRQEIWTECFMELGGSIRASQGSYKGRLDRAGDLWEGLKCSLLKGLEEEIQTETHKKCRVTNEKAVVSG